MQKVILIILIPLIGFISACTKQSSPNKSDLLPWQEILGRDSDTENGERVPIYRARVPSGWQAKVPSSSIKDTMLPIMEYTLSEGDQKIRITIHNFPSEKIDERIPPIAQVTRWKNQFEKLDPANISISPVSWGGFSGLFFQAEGKLNKQDQMVMAWIMQLAPEYYETLEFLEFGQSNEVRQALRQMRADYSIKAQGDLELMNAKKGEIEKFAKNFELIQELPMRQ